MVHYIHLYGRQHGITTDTAHRNIRLLEQAINNKFGENAQCHGICYHQDRIRPHPSWIRRELVYACAGEKGNNLLNEVWYNTWIFRINLTIEGNLDERTSRALLGLHMKVVRIQFTERGPNETIKRMRHLRDEIPWLADGSVKLSDTGDSRYFGRRFEIGRDI
ncbi:hypothetical protein N7537_010472 [Penicillium hordei]|uniref:Uncharacterized protein n=1 Tax=Penicillium hordei TaxID=40994 RepID=A0AAD6DUQ0_9EURO|nr:uncharacterized protein N7537_010472 [Penicillium hordei]KAJ5593568.1 hypothetical protein N7537_010472 [Penicillium hordei]